MAIDRRSLKAYVRYDGNGRIIPGSLILNRFKPQVGDWQETPAYECCNYIPITTTTTTTLFPALRFTTIIDNPETQQGYVGLRVAVAGGSVDGVIDWGDDTIDNINIPDDGNIHPFSHAYDSTGSYTGVITLDSPEQLLQLFFDGND